MRNTISHSSVIRPSVFRPSILHFSVWAVLVLFCFCFVPVLAVPAYQGCFTVKQGDGAVLTLRLVGDEFFHYYENVATGERLFRGNDGFFRAVAEQDIVSARLQGNLRRSSAIKAREQRSQSALFRPLSSPSSPSKVSAPQKLGRVSRGLTGTKRGLVILVEFPDMKMAESHDREAFTDQFNQEGYSQGGHVGSVHDYFYDQSYGAFNLTFDVVGPVTVSHPMAYYGANDEYGNDSYAAEMVIEACQLAAKSALSPAPASAAPINFSDYDWDGDGEVDQVFVIYAGYGEAYGADPNTIWPHEWQLSSAKLCGNGTGAQVIDGVRIDTYACSCERSGTAGTTLNGIGTACHEFSHCLGFPDFYDTDYSGGFGMNVWDVMDRGAYNGPNGCGEVPAGYTSYERLLAGWISPSELTELSAPCTITSLAPLGEQPQACIVYNDRCADEYILLENRQNDKWFRYVGTSTTPHGLLAIHVDFDASAWSGNTPNDNPSHQCMSIIPANGTYGSVMDYGEKVNYHCTASTLQGHVFGGSGTVTSLTPTSHSSCGGKWFTACSTGTTAFNHEVTQIENHEDGTMGFCFDGGSPEDDGSRWTVSFVENGHCIERRQETFRQRISVPEVADVVSFCEDEEVCYTFAGWSPTELLAETTSAPTFAAVVDGQLLPSADVTLYAVYRRHTGTLVSGCTLQLDYKGSTYYVAEPDVKGTRFLVSEEAGETLYYDETEGLLWLKDDEGQALYAYNSSSEKTDLKFSTHVPSADFRWKIECVDGGLTFSRGDRFLGLNSQSKNMVRAYKGNYPHLWKPTQSSDVFCKGGEVFFTTHPVSVATVSAIIDRMRGKVGSNMSASALEILLQKVVNGLLGQP